MTSMRMAILLLAASVSANAEFRRVDVDFEGTGCASCAESLPSRLQRVRGVESAEVDLDRNRVTVHLDAGNKTRLAPLLSRITQDGTKIVRVEALARGTITGQANALTFQLSGLNETYTLKPAEGTSIKPQQGTLYEAQGVFSGLEAAAEAVLQAKSIEAVPAESR